MDPIRYLETEDDLVRSIMHYISETYQQRQRDRMREQAILIINELGKAFKRA